MSRSFNGKGWSESRNESAQVALTILRLGLGSLFVSVFFENLGKGLYSPSGYSGLINYYIEKGHGPQVLLLIGLLTRPVALGALLFLSTLWVAEWGTSWIWELLIPMIVAFALMIGGAGRKWGVDALLARRYPGVPLW